MRTEDVGRDGLAQVRRVGVENVPPPFADELCIVKRANIRERRKDAVDNLYGELKDGAFGLELLGHLAGGHEREKCKMVAGGVAGDEDSRPEPESQMPSSTSYRPSPRRQAISRARLARSNYAPPGTIEVAFSRAMCCRASSHACSVFLDNELYRMTLPGKFSSWWEGAQPTCV